MAMPGFNGGASLGHARGVYRGAVRSAGTSAVVPAQAPCTAGGWCGTTSGQVCPCPPGRTCSRRCSTSRDCRVNWLSCVLFPPFGCLPQCTVTRLCSIDLFCD
jgi:hypothetical protein